MLKRGICHAKNLHLIWSWLFSSWLALTSFWNEVSWMAAVLFSSKCYRNCVVWFQLAISQRWFRWWLGAEHATRHCLNQWWPRSLTRTCITWPYDIPIPTTHRVIWHKHPVLLHFSVLVTLYLLTSWCVFTHVFRVASLASMAVK